MIEIDEATGLPALPEGYRWNVTDKDILWYKDDWSGSVYKSSGKNLRVILQNNRAVKGMELNPKKHWWNREPEYRTVESEEWCFVDHKVTKGIHSIAVIDAARAIYRRFDDQRVRNEAAAELVGIYPPKKLKED